MVGLRTTCDLLGARSNRGANILYGGGSKAYLKGPILHVIFTSAMYTFYFCGSCLHSKIFFPFTILFKIDICYMYMLM